MIEEAYCFLLSVFMLLVRHRTTVPWHLLNLTAALIAFIFNGGRGRRQRGSHFGCYLKPGIPMTENNQKKLLILSSVGSEAVSGRCHVWACGCLARWSLAPRRRRGGFYFDGPTTWREGVVILGICPWWLSSGLVLQHLQLAKAPDNLNGGGDDGP